MRGVYYTYYDIFTNRCTTLLPDGELKEYVGTRFLCDISTKGKGSIVFINNLLIIKHLISGSSYDDCEDVELKKEIPEWSYGKIQFRSMCTISNMPRFYDLCKLYDTDCIPQAFKLFVESLGDPKDVKRSLALCISRLFYKDLDIEVCSVHRQKMFEMCIAGLKCGEMPKIDAIRKLQPHIYGADSYDIRSAYASILCTDDKYPLGKIHASKARVKERLSERLQKGLWCKIIFSGKVDDLGGFYDEDYDLTALDYYDILYLRDIDKDDIFRHLDKSPTILWSDDTGYLDKSFRDKMHETYVLKQSLDHDDPRRFFVKMQLEMVYGKSIQKRESTGDLHLKNQLKSRYLQPQHGIHTSAAIRYFLAKAIMDIGISAFYWDTDCIKVRNDFNFDHESYFKALNKEIIDRNHRAGYDSDIGTFKHEGHYDEIKVYSLKVYCFRIGDNWDFTASGYAKDLKSEFLTASNGKSLIDIFDKSGVRYVHRRYRIVDGLVEICYVYKNPLAD